MVKALRVALVCTSFTAFAQSNRTPDGGVPNDLASPKLTAPAAKDDVDEVRREMDAKVENAKKELREEMRAQMASQSVAQGWQEEWAGEKRKLQLFVPNGYLRLRPDLFYKFDLGRGPDPSGYLLFPHSPLTPVTNHERTTAGVNMRFRFEPTINVSEEVRIKTQIDALDNVILGSTPDYAGSRSDRDVFSIFSQSQSPPRAGLNSVQDSIEVKRVYGEVTTPLGILRFGRMGSHWGLGMLHNDGNCLDCDRGDTVDRIMFVAQPVTDFYISPMIDWNGIGPTSARTGEGGQPFPLTNQDQTISYIIAIARRDTEQQLKTKLQNGLSVLNFGIHFTIRSQKNDPAGFYANVPLQPGGDIQDPYRSVTNDNLGPLAASYIPRRGTLYIPDLWIKYERKKYRLEFEGAAVLGSFGTRATDPAKVDDPAYNPALDINQWGAVGQSEFRLLDGSLRLGLEVGFASGGKAPGFGNRQGRLLGVDSRGNRFLANTVPGNIDGPQYCVVVSDTCHVNTINNFRFNRDYRIDMILWREILGGVTDALYFKPSLNYEVADGFLLFFSVIYSRAAHAYTTPSTISNSLGIELNMGARYETDDGFFAQFAWGVLFPLGGLQQPPDFPNPPGLDTAQALRGMLGIRF
jgi:uncharacterized protein (TIGR04551 family)